MITKDLHKFTCSNRLSKKESSVHYGKKRFDKAREQSNMSKKSVDEIIRITNEFLRLAGLNKTENPVVDMNENPLIDYDVIKEKNGINSRKHIIWMKFTKDGHLGVVAASDDVNFEIPPNKSVYNDTTNGEQKNGNNKWKWNTSGIIVHSLDKVWDESFVLIFPIKNIEDRQRKDIECGIGNYLIEEKVPILDYYSHRF